MKLTLSRLDWMEQEEALMATADTLDDWAEESRTGGWSTHQVEPNRKMANDLRRRAAEIRRALVTTP